jgi:glucosamine--fructose-6-phosphate aminotransferase (isomerizing)
MSVLPPTPERTSHPFYTYEMIREIPAGFRATLSAMALAEIPPLSAPITFTGSGTAFYAASMGSQVLNLTDVPWKTVHGFELTHYERLAKGGTVVGVSHSGITKSTVDALSKARREGLYVIGLTHFPARPISEVAHRTFVIGNGPDNSRCHTKTYVTSAAAVLTLSLKYAELHGVPLVKIQDGFGTLDDLLLKTVHDAEAPAKDAASELSGVKKIYFAGAGPNVVTAKEAALKIKETSFLGAEGLELEETLHGPWVSIDSETLVVVIAGSEASSERARTLLKASHDLGAKTMVVTDSEFDADYTLRFPHAHEYLTPFLLIIPLYFFSYFLAVKKGHNPDYLRYLDQRYWDARQIIFPPGTH